MPKEVTIDQWNALPFCNDFMFSKSMGDMTLCKEVAELLLGKKVGEVKDFQEEKTINITHDSKSVRLDVYLRDEEKTVNLEMQVSNGDDLKKRSRYYQDLIDLSLLEIGWKYKELPENYVIFICTFDAIGNGRAKNTFQNLNDETGEALGDGTYKIYFNSKAKAENPKLQAFLNYVNGEVSEDDLVQRLEERVKKIKSNVEWRTEYMKFEIDRQNLEAKAKQEGIQEEKYTIAKNLIGTLPPTEIAIATGLPLSTVEELGANA